MKRIRKNNVKKIKEIASAGYAVIEYLLSNQFQGVEMNYKDEDALYKFIMKHLNEGCELWEYELEKAPQRFKLDVHSNCWYRFV